MSLLLLSLDGIDYPVFKDDSFVIPLHQTTILMGRSGIGKSTFLHHLRKFLVLQNIPNVNRNVGRRLKFLSRDVYGGVHEEVKIDHQRSHSLSHEGYKRISLLQHNHNLLPWKTVAENITLCDGVHQKSINHDRLVTCVGQVGLSDWQQAYPHQLSQGMRQRVVLARLLYEDADFILMDEPFNHIDETTLVGIYAAFKAFFTDKTVIMTTHEREEALLFANCYYYLHGSPVEIQQVAV